MRPRKLPQLQQLTVFPSPRRREALLGVLARGYVRYGDDVSSYMTALIGKIRCPGTLDPATPTYMARIASVMPEGHPLHDLHHLLMHHSAVPYYLFFASADRKAKVEASIGDPRKSNLTCILGLSTARLKPSPYPMECSKCIAEERVDPGCPTYHIEHQLPTTWVCTRHGGVLSEGCGKCARSTLPGKLLTLPGYCTDPATHVVVPCTVIDDAERADIDWLAVQGARLITRYGDAPQDPLGVMRSAALSRFTRCGGLDGAALATVIERRFSREILARLGLTFRDDHDRARGWHWQLLSNSTRDRLKETAQCLIVLGALFDDVDAYLAAPAATTVPIRKPDPTPASWTAALRDTLAKHDHMIDPVRHELGVTFSQLWKEMLRQGITLPRPARSRLPEADYQQLVKCWEQGLDQAEIQRRFGVSEHFMKMVVLWEPGLMRRWQIARRGAHMDPFKQQLSEFLQQNPGAGRSKLRLSLQTAYEAVYDKDRPWIEANVPRRQGNFRSFDGVPRARKNWVARDADLAVRIRQIATDHLGSEARPIHLTLGWILRKLEWVGRYYENAERLPKSREALDQYCESFEVYRLRRLVWSAKECARTRQPLSVMTLQRLSGFPTEPIHAHWTRIVEIYDAGVGSAGKVWPLRKKPKVKRAATRPERAAVASRQMSLLGL